MDYSGGLLLSRGGTGSLACRAICSRDGRQWNSARRSGPSQPSAPSFFSSTSPEVRRRISRDRRGTALGREGPTVQMGGTIGRLLGDRFGRFLPEPWTLIAAGAGAGLAVAFNAPLAAAIFVAEELIRRFSVRIFVATVVSCIVATTVSRGIIGNRPDFAVGQLGFAAPLTLVGYLMLGVFAGLLGIAFNRSLLWTIEMFGRAAKWPRGSEGAIVGAAVGLLAWRTPHLIGGGDVVAQQAITMPVTIFAALGILLLRFVLTMGSYACGAPGGILRRCWRWGAARRCFRRSLPSLSHPDGAGPVRDHRDGSLFHRGRPLAAHRGRAAAGNDRLVDVDSPDDGRFGQCLRDSRIIR